jgi:hypothetical protein
MVVFEEFKLGRVSCKYVNILFTGGLVHTQFWISTGFMRLGVEARLKHDLPKRPYVSEQPQDRK